MNNMWILLIALAVFLIMNAIYYVSMKGYAKETFGKKWLSIWGNKVWFWQSSIFVSTGATVLIIYLLKWCNLLSF